ncbi:hypothetical protein [Glycomyces algeriensis]|uniref:Uncharacterized protein n=1 Tax=Glycomyces algeriensis TaxID=256037 RepID=A0A9W6LJL7_9ACTN|nr:hypothetical protein [Glycomyces algeriensis]MDA1369065.1 hypothetical protein [Glycomyces algeriensis]MDR7352439.1 hypothetical protein [Glycomyces algeriensis]GLI45179.1 hypothetical protein GALLR39Z86_50290 [Glycomyces algeriensis]
MAAERRDFETGELASVPESSASHDLWQRMAAPLWPAFVDELAAVRPGSERVDRAELVSQASDLADVLEHWLGLLGFQWVDLDEGFSFKVASWDFQRPEAPGHKRAA